MRLLKPILPKNDHKEQIINKVEAYRKLDREYKALKKRKDALQADIIHDMGDQTEVINFNNHVIATLSQIKGRESFNKKAFQLDYPGVYENYTTVGKSSIRFNLR